MKPAILLSVIVLCGCAHLPYGTSDSATVPGVVKRDGLGSICPTGPREAYTAYHVVLQTRPGAVYFVPILWATADAYGSAYPLYGDSRRDLAVLLSDTDFPSYFHRSAAAPAIGDELTVVGYDWAKNGIPRKAKKIKVLSVFGGSITVDGTAGPGSSGSCLINSAGEAVGIHHWAFTDSKLNTGVAAAIWGAWGEIPLQWRDHEVPGWTGYELLKQEVHE